MEAYRLLAYGCERVWGMETLPEIQRGRWGKPYFHAEGGRHFSLSHSAGWAMCALSDAPVGCDMETIRPRRDGLPQRVFRREMDWEEFYRRWTAMEAYGKWTGRGIGELVGTEFALPPEVTLVQRRRENMILAVCREGECQVKIEEV